MLYKVASRLLSAVPRMSVDDADADTGVNDGTSCSICLGAMTEQDTTTISCGHTFHSSCVVDVFRRGDSRCRDGPHAADPHAALAVKQHVL